MERKQASVFIIFVTILLRKSCSWMCVCVFVSFHAVLFMYWELKSAKFWIELWMCLCVWGLLQKSTHCTTIWETKMEHICIFHLLKYTQETRRNALISTHIHILIHTYTLKETKNTHKTTRYLEHILAQKLTRISMSCMQSKFWVIPCRIWSMFSLCFSHTLSIPSHTLSLSLSLCLFLSPPPSGFALFQDSSEYMWDASEKGKLFTLIL